MNDINTVSLLNQMRALSARASGVEFEKTPSAPSAFGGVLQNALNQVNDLNQKAESLKSRYEMGDSEVSLSEVMVASQKANLGFEATLRVRNKVVQAYQDIMNMPV